MKKRKRTCLRTISLRLPEQLYRLISNDQVRDGKSIAEWTRSLYSEALRRNPKPGAQSA
ncbi:MAG TPA: hypothetical protein VKW04_18285 [Planctomycetota bacterium]|nr:hypothetical protein [Planctomycetota bacterium]HLY11256.1 hypothetical protein [Planctomycetota bacterium]